MAPHVTIDLASLIDPVLTQFRRALSDFALANPATEVCTVGLLGDGFHGTMSICLDTPAHCQEHVAEWGPKGEAGKDEYGAFCENLPDFAIWLSDHHFHHRPAQRARRDFASCHRWTDASSCRGCASAVRRLEEG